MKPAGLWYFKTGFAGISIDGNRGCGLMGRITVVYRVTGATTGESPLRAPVR